MIIFGFALIGALVGARSARVKQGNRLDIAQYSAAHAIAFAVLGLVVTVVLDRTVL